jgi:hypothetical protein
MLNRWSGIAVSAIIFAGFLWDLSPSPAAAPLTPQTSDVAGVRVVVTPKNVDRDARIWGFEIVMDTHTKPLNDNLAQASVMIDGAGGRYEPVGWTGDGPGGHHRKGVLQFPAPKEMPTTIELQIDGIGGAGVRKFQWELK